MAGFHALGTLMAVGIMVLPAATARFWVRSLSALILLASASGLLISHHADWLTSPTIVLCLGVAYIVSMLLAPFGLRAQQRSFSHLQA